MTKHIIIVEASKCTDRGDPDFSFHKDGEISPYILEKLEWLMAKYPQLEITINVDENVDLRE